MTIQFDLPATMRAVTIPEFGEADVMRIAELPVPEPAPHEVLIQVSAAGLNRGDTVQRRGHYPPPPGVSDVPGLEVSGTVVAVGAGVVRWRPGDAVCAILAGGGYAEFCVAPAEQCLPIPPGVDLIQAAALPETYCTVWDAVWSQARLAPGDRVLIHGGSSGIGVTAIQLLAAWGNPVYATAGTDDKCAVCETLGATRAFNYRKFDFVAEVLHHTGGDGVDIILDMVGGDYLPRNLASLAMQGRLVVIGVQGGVEATVNLRELMRRRITLIGTTLRSRSIAYKARICAELEREVWPRFGTGQLNPVIHQVFPMDDVADAHRCMEQGSHTGKLLLIPR